MFLTNNFTQEEMICPCCSVAKMNMLFMMKLQTLRDVLCFPLILNSAFRCEKHNSEINGAPESRHLQGQAVDITLRNLSPAQKSLLISNALTIFDGVGLCKTFIHVDTREGVKALWFY